MHFFDNTFLHYLNIVHDWLNQPSYGALFCISFLASSLVPIGSEWLLVMMLANGYEPVGTLVTATAGNYLGAVTTYLVGRFGGGWMIHRVFRITPEQQQQAESYYRKYGVYSLFFSWIPVIGDPLCLAGGVLRINFMQFTLLVASGKLIRYAVTAWLTLKITG
jgi:membrane protein YqaA with SNARE-associated domain